MGNSLQIKILGFDFLGATPRKKNRAKLKGGIDVCKLTPMMTPSQIRSRSNDWATGAKLGITIKVNSKSGLTH